MARPKSYDREQAVEKACYAFWQHGYQALGVRELERLTGINQFALRTEFGGKEGLYLEALKFYSEAAITQALAPLQNGGLAEIMAFLKNLVTEGSMTCSAWGCLIVNTGIENARIESKKLEAATQFYWSALESHFRQSILNAQRAGEISAALDGKALAKGLTTAVMGVHAHNRENRSCTGGHALVALICRHLESLRIK